jgi:hypothetical protein
VSEVGDIKQSVPIGTIVGYQIMWVCERQRWETVDELTFYRAMHNENALCFGRFLRAQADETLTNEDGVIKPVKEPQSP